MTGRRSLAAAVPVAVVAVVAAWISYGHIESLALAEHQTIAAARTLPLAVDGLIAAGSVILLTGYALGWACLVPGVAATLFANVESGIGYGPLAATVAAWPAVAFTVASFVLERWLRRQARGVPAEEEYADTPEALGVPELAVEVHRYEGTIFAVRTAVYQFFAADDTKLYVGLTAYPKSRLADHKRTKPWWPEVTRVEIVWYENRLDAADAELAVIDNEHPKYNVQTMLDGLTGRVHPGKGRRLPPVPVPPPDREPQPGYLRANRAHRNGYDADVKTVTDALGTEPSVRAVKDLLHCGQPRAVEVCSRVRALIPAG